MNVKIHIGEDLRSFVRDIHVFFRFILRHPITESGNIALSILSAFECFSVFGIKGDVAWVDVNKLGARKSIIKVQLSFFNQIKNSKNLKKTLNSKK